MHTNLTEQQVEALSFDLNLADGHAYRSWTARETLIIDDSPRRFRDVDRKQMDKIELSYYESFYELAQQPAWHSGFDRFACFTASTGIEIIANYIRLRRLSVSLVEPCFDNLKDILLRHNIPLVAFDDAVMESTDEDFQMWLQSITTDVVFVVSPNNPTGSMLNRSHLAMLAEHCAGKNIILILDACFRFYLPDELIFDQYDVLRRAGVECIVIEDTGKTWPTVELKAPFISVSQTLSSAIAHINSDFLLHVSPFSIQLLTDFVRASIADKRESILNPVKQNRETLENNLRDTSLTVKSKPYMSVAWLDLGSADLDASTVVERAARRGVQMLPGEQFFWSELNAGSDKVRIALVRDPDMFVQAAALLAQEFADGPEARRP